MILIFIEYTIYLINSLNNNTVFYRLYVNNVVDIAKNSGRALLEECGVQIIKDLYPVNTSHKQWINYEQ